jgi:hypothetical protein
LLIILGTYFDIWNYCKHGISNVRDGKGAKMSESDCVENIPRSGRLISFFELAIVRCL